MSDRRDSSCAMMTAISEAAANQKQTCEFELCQIFTSYFDDDKFLTLIAGQKYRIARPRKRSDILVSAAEGRSL